MMHLYRMLIIDAYNIQVRNEILTILFQLEISKVSFIFFFYFCGNDVDFASTFQVVPSNYEFL